MMSSVHEFARLLHLLACKTDAGAKEDVSSPANAFQSQYANMLSIP